MFCICHILVRSTKDEILYILLTVTDTGSTLHNKAGYSTTHVGIPYLSHISTQSGAHHSWSAMVPTHPVGTSTLRHLPVFTHPTLYSPPVPIEERAETPSYTHCSQSFKSTQYPYSAHSIHGSYSAKSIDPSHLLHSTNPPHSAYSTHPSHITQSTHSAVHHTHTVEKRQGQDEIWTGTDQIQMSTAPVVGSTESALNPSFIPPDLLSVLPLPTKAVFDKGNRFEHLALPRNAGDTFRGEPLTMDPTTDPTAVRRVTQTRNSRGPCTPTHTVNPFTLQNATTIALSFTTYCLTTLYLPHSPDFHQGTKTVWTSTATLYPEWDCHGCPSLTVVDPWTISEPTSHYHHTTTSSSILSVASPVCRPSQTSIGVTFPPV
jgi:hypothetical protein